ncbi:MAG: NAD-dependent epimerase/dehydratase family protein [Leifsonia sp.]
MKTALIGYTGFVGSNLASRYEFDDVYNSMNIAEIAGRSYDLVVTAGNRADSFRINRDEAGDLAEVDALGDHLESARIDKLVLVSTVCVYPAGGTPDESTPLTDAALTPYGRNRLHQERRLSAAFDTLVVRLPQLYGDALKKGLIYDLSNDYRVEYIRPENEFQYYDVRRLWSDIGISLDAGLASMNIATEPVRNAEVAEAVFGRDITGNTPPGPVDPFAAMYTRSMTTLHAALFGGSGPFLASKDQVLADISEFTRRTAASDR